MRKTDTRVEYGKYIVVKRRNKFIKLYLKDLKAIRVRSKKVLPPVPQFHQDTKTDPFGLSSTSTDI